MSPIDLIFAIVAAQLFLMIVLQTVLNKRVWDGYLLGLPITLIAWVIYHYYLSR